MIVYNNNLEHMDNFNVDRDSDYNYNFDENNLPVNEVDLTEENDSNGSTTKHGTRVAGLHDAIRYIEIRNEVFGDIKEFTCSYNPHDGSWNLEVETDD